MDQDISISIQLQAGHPLKEEWLQSIVRKVLETESVSSPVEMGLVIAGAELVQQLNRDYRGKDEPTDVLAFSMLPQTTEAKSSFVIPPDGVNHLGEVVISYPQAATQAAELKHTLEQEIALLIIHGALHLLGYDHEQPEQEKQMRVKENEIMEALVKESPLRE